MLRDDDDRQFEADLQVGTYQLRVVHPQFGEWEKSIHIAPESQYQFAIDFRKMVKLTVAATPVEGNVFIDGQATSYQTPREFDLRVGKHTIEVRRKGYILEGGPRVINLEEDLTEPLLFTLKKVR